MKTTTTLVLSSALSLLLPPVFLPSSFAQSSGCVSTGSLGKVMQNCTPSIVSPRKPKIKEKSFHFFSKNWTLRVRVPQGDWHSAVRSSVARWVATRLYPQATMEENILLDSAIQHLARVGFPFEASKESDLIAKVNVTAETLNRIASRLINAVRKGHPSYHVARIMVTGGTDKENRFAAKHLPLPKDGILEADKMSEKLYAISQIPGFTRADGLMAPVILTRNVTFSLPHILTIHTDKTDWLRDIRRQVVLQVALLMVDQKTIQSRKIVETLSDQLSSVTWPLMTVQKEQNNSYRVEVPPLLLNTLKNILVEAAETGTVNASSYVVNQKGELSTGNLFAPAPTLPEYDNFLVNLTPTPTYAGSQIELDNYGYAPVGAVVLNATGNANNVGVAGGLFTVTASTSFGGMNAGAVSYSLPIGLYVRTGADFNAMNYTLGLGFSPWGHGTNVAALTALGVSGSNYSGDLWISQTLSEREDRRLVLKETAFVKEFQDTYSPTVQNDRSLIGGVLDLSGSRKVGRIFMDFDLSDTEYDLSQGSGSSPDNPFYYDTVGLQNFLSGTGEIRLTLSPKYSLTLGTVDQQYFGGGVLDPMLQATLGGVANVMALPTAALFGNNLYVGTLTATRTDPITAGVLSTSAFFDAGQVVSFGTDFAAMGPGLEEAFSTQHYFARLDAAVPVGPLPLQALGTTIPALNGGHLDQGGIPIQVWISLGIRD